MRGEKQMQNILSLIKERRSVRRYKSDAVPSDLLDAAVEAGLYAASGLGRQSSIILRVTDRTMRDRLMRANAMARGRAGSDPFYGAPVILTVLADRNCPTYLYDGALSLGNMMLAAHAVGLGSCWIHYAKETFETEEGKEILRALGVNGNYEGIGHLAVGYPDGEYPLPPARRAGRVFDAD